MAATFGKIEEFQPEFESIAAYLEIVELFFDANNIPAARHVPMRHWQQELLPTSQLARSDKAKGGYI